MKQRNMPPVGKCFDHLGGKLAPILFNRLIDMKWIQPKKGRKTVFEVTDIGKKHFEEIFQINTDEII
jgi:hypothetical protein